MVNKLTDMCACLFHLVDELVLQSQRIANPFLQWKPAIKSKSVAIGNILLKVHRNQMSQITRFLLVNEAI